jgi:hypothetical protein
LALNGFDADQIKEAGWVAQSVAGASAYLYSTGYDQTRFENEVNQIAEHIKANR